MANGTGYVNQGTDARVGGPVGAVFAALQRASAFKSATPPKRLVYKGVYLQFEFGHSRPRFLPFVGVAVRNKAGWQTFRIGWRWDSNWGDERVQGYNPHPEIVGGYFADVIWKRNQQNSHIGL